MDNTEVKQKRNILKRILLLTGFTDGTAEEALLLWAVIAVWLHYVVSGAIMVILLSSVLLFPGIRQRALAERQLFFLGCAIASFSFLVSVIAKNLIGMAISFGVFVIITVGCAVKSSMTEVRFEKLQVVSCVGSIVSVLFAAIQKFLIYGDNLQYYRPTAFAFNANYYGMLIVMSMLICVFNLFGVSKKREKGSAWYERGKLFYLIVFTLNSGALALSESRSSLLAFMVCTVVYMLITKRYLFFGLAIVFAGGIIMLGWFFPNILSWTNSLTFSFTQRYDIWLEALRSFSQNPYTALLGRGPMTYYLVKDTEGLIVADHAHNFFVDTLLNVGIIGSVMYLLLFGYFLKEMILGLRRGGRNEFVIVALFVLQIFVQGIADVTIMWHQCALMFMLVFAFVGPEKNRTCGNNAENL